MPNYIFVTTCPTCGQVTNTVKIKTSLTESALLESALLEEASFMEISPFHEDRCMNDEHKDHGVVVTLYRSVL